MASKRKRPQVVAKPFANVIVLIQISFEIQLHLIYLSEKIGKKGKFDLGEKCYKNSELDTSVGVLMIERRKYLKGFDAKFFFNYTWIKQIFPSFKVCLIL